MTEITSSENHTISGHSDAVLTRNQVFFEGFVASPYNRIVVMGNVVTRRRRPHRQGYITNYYLNGRRVSLDALRVFFAKPLPELRYTKLNLISCAARYVQKSSPNIYLSAINLIALGAQKRSSIMIE